MDSGKTDNTDNTGSTGNTGDTGTTMRAVVSRAGGALETPGSLVDATVDAPGRPTGRDLHVGVEAISVNPVDTKTRRKDNPDGTDRILGWDAVATVLAVGDSAEGFAPGDRVYYAGSIARAGSYAQQQLVDSALVSPAPTTLSNEEAAALPLTSLTAWEALFDKFRVGADSRGTLLVIGGAGGVGSILIQLAKELTQLTVIATASREESAAWVTEMGADVVVNHHDADVIDQILTHAPGGVDYAFSAHSEDKTEFFSQVMRAFGQIVSIDTASDLDLFALKNKAITWHWEYMFARALYDYHPEEQGQALRRIAELVDAGKLRTTLRRSVEPIKADTIRAAHAELEDGHVVGKIVLSGWDS